MQQIYDNINLDIKQYGLSVMGVYPTKEDEGLPFTYSIGLCVLDIPELLIVGLGPRQAQPIINSLYQQYIEELINWSKPCIIADCMGNGYSLAFLSVEDERCKKDYTIQVGQFFGSEDYQVMQVIFPDKHGKFPWDDDYDAEHMPDQGDLYSILYGL